MISFWMDKPEKTAILNHGRGSVQNNIQCNKIPLNWVPEIGLLEPCSICPNLELGISKFLFKQSQKWQVKPKYNLSCWKRRRFLQEPLPRPDGPPWDGHHWPGQESERRALNTALPAVVSLASDPWGILTSTGWPARVFPWFNICFWYHRCGRSAKSFHLRRSSPLHLSFNWWMALGSHRCHQDS